MNMDARPLSPPTEPGTGETPQDIMPHTGEPGYDICPAPKELPPNYMINGYRIMRCLGEGGFGVTYLATDALLQRRVVIKENFPHCLCERRCGTLNVEYQSHINPEDYQHALSNFQREVRLLARLNHPNLLKIYAYFEAHNTSYFVTEFVDGMMLTDVVADYLKHLHFFPQQDLYSLMVRILDALSYMHEHHILHLDIKPDNILIARDGRPVLIDMGAARDMTEDAPAVSVETPFFSAPEQGDPHLPQGPWTDLYAFAATLYFLLAGTPPPPARQRALYDTITPLAAMPTLRSHYNIQLLASIDKAMAPAIEDRYESVAAWMDDLREN